MNERVDPKRVFKERNALMDMFYAEVLRQGRTLVELADKAGIDVHTIYVWLAKDDACPRGPSVWTFLAVLLAMDVKIDLICTRKTRLLTLSELRTLKPGTVVWEDYREDDHQHDHLVPMMVTRPGHMIGALTEEEVEMKDDLLKHDDWGFQSRYWSAKPTGAQMREAAWT